MAINFKEPYDETHIYYIIVPINEEGREQLYQYNFRTSSGEVNSNFKAMVFNEETFLYAENRLLDIINIKCNKLINMYEEEVIEPNQLPTVKSIIENVLSVNEDEKLTQFAKELLELVIFALDNNKEIGFYF